MMGSGCLALSCFDIIAIPVDAGAGSLACDCAGLFLPGDTKYTYRRNEMRDYLIGSTQYPDARIVAAITKRFANRAYVFDTHVHGVMRTELVWTKRVDHEAFQGDDEMNSGRADAVAQFSEGRPICRLRGTYVERPQISISGQLC